MLLAALLLISLNTKQNKVFIRCDQKSHLFCAKIKVVQTNPVFTTRNAFGGAVSGSVVHNTIPAYRYRR